MMAIDSARPRPGAGSDWELGWYAGALRLDSPNFGPRPADAVVDLVLLHSISLPPGEFGGPVRRDASVLQFVSCDARAWHAGASCHRGRDNCNDFSIGIELEGLEGGLFEPGQYTVTAALCAAIGRQYPIQHVAGHEHVAPGRKFDPGAGFDWPLLRRSLAWDAAFFPPGV